MHIVFLTSEYPKKGFPHGGVGTVVQNIARGLVLNQYQVSIIGLNYIPKDEIDNDQGVKIIRLKRKKIKLITWYLNSKTISKAISDLHKKQPIHIIESAEMGFAFINKLKGIKYLMRLHGGHHFFAESEKRKINPWKAFQEKRSFKNADYVIGVSQFVVDHTSKYMDFKDKFRGVIYNMANLERFTPNPNSKEIKGRVFFAGSICEKKGIRQLIKAMPKVIKAIPEAYLVIAGRDTKIRGTDKSYMEFLKTEIDDNNTDKIFFLGNVANDKLSNEIEKAEVCVYPSHMEAMPLAWLEVLSMEKPLVASNLGPGKEVVFHHKTGLLCNPFDIKTLAEQIIYVLNNRDEAHKMGQNAKIDINKRFNPNKLIKENIALYQYLIKE